MKRIVVLVLLGGCADPAVLDVRVDVVEADLQRIQVVVRRGLQPGAPAVVDCGLGLNASPEGLCPFSAGEGAWNDPRRLAFVLYGDPSTELSVSIDGFRDGRSVTATVAETRLPDREGERRTLELALFGRTRPRFSCSEVIPPAEMPGGLTSPEDLSGIAAYDVTPDRTDNPADRRAIELVASARGRLSLIQYRRTEEGCSLAMTSLSGGDCAVPWCHIAPDSLAVGGLGFAGDSMVGAAKCAAPAVGQRGRMLAFTRGGRCGIRVSELSLLGPPGTASAPVIVDLEGDGAYEVAFVEELTRTVGAFEPGVYLTVWSPLARDPVRTRLEGVQLTAVTPPPSPAVVPVREPAGGSAILIAAHAGAVGVLHAGTFRRVATADTSAQRAPSVVVASAAVAAVLVGDLFVVAPYEDGQLVLRQIRQNGREWTQVGSRSVPLLTPLTPSFEHPIALGAVDDGGAFTAVIMQDGVAQLYPLIATQPARTLDLWNGSVSGAQFTLLANFDGPGNETRAGAELVSFSQDSSRVWASDAAGDTPDGWPIEIAHQTGARRVLLADLDGGFDSDVSARALLDLEVVTLTDNRVEVFTLGPGSYDPAQTPWPMPFRDAARRAAFRDARDPSRVVEPQVRTN